LPVSIALNSFTAPPCPTAVPASLDIAVIDQTASRGCALQGG